MTKYSLDKYYYSRKKALSRKSPLLYAKVICTIIIVVTIAVLFISPIFNETKKQLEFDLSKKAIADNILLQPKMSNPKFHGLTKENEPYELSAEKAIQKNAQEIELLIPSANFKTSDNKEMYIISQKGLMQQDIKELKLEDDVNLFYDNDFHMETETAFIKLSDDVAYGYDPVKISGTKGELKANSFIFFKKEGKIEFDGSVKLIIQDPS